MLSELSKPTFMMAALIGGLALFVAALLAPLVLILSPAESAYSGANGRIAFISDRDGDNEIYVMNADGSGVTQVTDNTAEDRNPDWSPDGSRIAFDSDRDGNREIYAMNAEGTGQTRLTDNPTHDGGPDWSPDGSQIAFTSDRDGSYEIYVMNADGTGQTNVSNNPAYDIVPSWSPDGSRIAFATYRDGKYEIYAMNADGTGQTNLSNNPARDTSPAWSPDGLQIAFHTSRDGPNPLTCADPGAGHPECVYEIYVMDPNGSGQTNLTNPPAGDARAAWSPDGSRIAFQSDRDGNNEIYVMNTDGSGQSRVTDNSAEDWQPDWQPVSGPVGGIAELPDVSDSSARNYAALAAAALVTLGASGWYASRRWSR
jgi:Tol biopolymer transport system component